MKEIKRKRYILKNINFPLFIANYPKLGIKKLKLGVELE